MITKDNLLQFYNLDQPIVAPAETFTAACFLNDGAILAATEREIVIFGDVTEKFTSLGAPFEQYRVIAMKEYE